MTAFAAPEFDVIRDGIQRSAEALVPELLSYLRSRGLRPGNVVDVGCGEGWWAAHFARRGLDVTGIDGPGGGAALEELGPFITADLAGPYPTMIPFDLAVCLEVAEHLPEAGADAFVAWLCTLAPVIVFSAAIPGQGGQGHLNEQWPDYWADLFHRHGYFCSGQFRRQIWDNDDIEHWYRQNLMVAWLPRRLRLDAEHVQRLVHPRLWAAHRNPDVWAKTA